MLKLDEHNRIIKDINNDVDYFLNEWKYEGPWQIKVLKYLANQGPEVIKSLLGLGPDDVDIEIEKLMSQGPEYSDDPNVVQDIEGREDVEELLARSEEALAQADAYEAQLQVGSMGAAGASGIATRAYNAIRVDFKGVNDLRVVTGGGKEMTERISGTLDFDILTFKETGKGYIMNLQNRNFLRGISLLLYTKTLANKPQTNKIQLTYNNGQFVGEVRTVSFRILRVR